MIGVYECRRITSSTKEQTTPEKTPSTPLSMTSSEATPPSSFRQYVRTQRTRGAIQHRRPQTHRTGRRTISTRSVGRQCPVDRRVLERIRAGWLRTRHAERNGADVRANELQCRGMGAQTAHHPWERASRDRYKRWVGHLGRCPNLLSVIVQQRARVASYRITTFTRGHVNQTKRATAAQFWSNLERVRSRSIAVGSNTGARTRFTPSDPKAG